MTNPYTDEFCFRLLLNSRYVTIKMNNSNLTYPTYVSNLDILSKSIAYQES